ncbi:hypothetical protein DES43_1662 [Aquamicrobium defluvii]|uniref:Uncharacterized protein n=1 Tax=Aquamicrobium defluvii TaxID=69279 RepID=A0A4R6Y441_9HYPH|nr:hypothetical protein DES43_1662 [Aquamicrobium defluvii]
MKCLGPLVVGAICGSTAYFLIPLFMGLFD